MKIVHETSPLIAVEVIRTRCVIGGPIQADDGLNARLLNHPNGPYNRSEIANPGVFLEFEWTGVMVQSKGNHWGPNLLHDQYPLRAFVPAGTNSHLHLTGIRFRPGYSWGDAVRVPTLSIFQPCGWRAWIASKRPGWKSREADRIAKEICNVLRLSPKIRVVSGC